MKSWSLKRRMSIVSALVLMLAFSIIYLVTKTAYTSASKARIQESLTAQIYALMAVAEDRDAQLTIPEILRNDQLNHLNSGLVAYVLDVDGDLIWRSRSSDTYAVLPDISLNYSLQKLTESTLDGRAMFWIGDRIVWEHENEMEGEYLFLIGEKQSILSAQVREYKREIATWLWITMFVLIFVLVFALNISLNPLKDAQQQIELISGGDADRVKGEFPKELAPLTTSVNLLLKSEALQKQRYRDTLGNLAHSLKTPLAVINSELQNFPDSQQQTQLIKQVERINDIVRYQLNRSVVTAGQTMRRKSMVEPEANKIIDALRKVHAAKNISIDANVGSETFFPGEQGDLMELVGNLADNACKWAASKVIIDISSNLEELLLSVQDDGPGVPAEKRKLILDRGKRLDQQAEGQGLGLSIVMDIIKTYQGDIQIDDSDLGGAWFKVNIPL
ncbi:ATP-binding protein [Aliikangiella coralliicola]|uniref:histidine kinase n=1 Tax=Aliikangiella coralliicola TaxID=2592383 RepID=A0A545U600_9GAMM|nr:ATP-binding protein [Aliikangiella coralliicola]TQV84900.1 GHKL domain-containing protein [Aliikangiella coralliicola]